MMVSTQGHADDLPVVVASIMRSEGTTGVHTHFRQFRAQLDRWGIASTLTTAFSSHAAIQNALFAPRKVLEPVSGSAGVWWYFKWHRVLLARALRQRLSGGEPVVIYAQSPTAAEAALQARRGPHQKVILAVHFGESVARGWTRRGTIPVGGWVDTGIRARERATIPRLDGLVHVSAEGRREMLEQIPEAAPVPHSVIPNFLPRRPMPTAQPTRDIITLGALNEPKNQRYIIEVVAQARTQGQDVTATIVGDGEDRADLEAQAKALKVDDLVDFAGYVANGERLIGDHRIYVHSSTYESLSLACIEALANGRPLLAGAVGGMPEVFDDGVEGRYWPLESPQEGAQMLVALLQDPTTYQQMATAARTRFESRFDGEVVVKRLYGFLQNVGRTIGT